MKSEVEDAKANIDSSNKARVSIFFYLYKLVFLNKSLNSRLEWKSL